VPTSDIEALARERPLASSELHPSNDFYGHAGLLKRYAGLGQSTKLKVSIEHGINFVDHLWDVDTLAGMPVFLCAGRERARLVQASLPDWCRAVAIGPLMRYTPSGDGGHPSGARTLVAFPGHSTHHLETDYDAAAFADRLVAEQGTYDQIAVCLYWRDIQRGVQRAYQDRGIECVTAGHMYDPRFMIRLRAILEGASEVVTNEVGTHIVYAVALDRPVWMFEQEVSVSADSEDVLRRDGADAAALAHRRLQEVRALFAERRSELSGAQREAIAELAGFADVRSPGQLAELFAEAEAAYRRRYPVATRASRRARRLLARAGRPSR